jgi:hypothetical protein
MTSDKPAPTQQLEAEPGEPSDAPVRKCTDDAQSDFAPKGFGAVLAQEYETIRTRRRTFGVTSGTGTKEQAGQRPADLFGIALSGGGIRSSSFCLGALQALDQYGLLCRADYLSTVSGGGYIAASMVAAMNTGAEDNTRERSPTGWTFPFTAGSNSDVSDTRLVGHIRDNGKFLAPHGLPDIGLSCAVLMRGLAVNLLMLMAVLFPLATIIIIANPTTEKLRHSILLDLVTQFGPESWSKVSFLSDPFILSKMTVIVLIYWLIGWAVFRSYKESDALRKARKRATKAAGSAQDQAPRTPPQEHSGKGAKFGRFLFIVLLVALAIEIQPQIINGLLAWAGTDGDGGSWFDTIVALAIAAGSIIIPTAAFESKLVAWIEQATSSSKWGVWLQALLARAAFYALGLALPLVIYGLFLVLVIMGIKLSTVEGNQYPFSPSALVTPDWGLTKLLGLTLALLLCLWFGSIIRSRYGRLQTIWRSLEIDAEVILVVLLTALLLAASAYATRAGASEQEWIVLSNYVLLTAIVLVIAVNFTENANGLHRLYRDRLRHTFDLKQTVLHELNDRCPYLLINGTLNVRRPRKKRKSRQADAQAQAETPDEFSADPAKRGRNAEFFLLSRHFIGSDATGYACSRELNKQQPELDLAAAVAISGAAVSSSMGRIGIGLLGPTLALLNLRLGYWLRNPKKLDPDQLGWEEIFRRYLFDEAFGRLHSGSPRIYITDGGHIDNIGLYQLLKRRCQFIIVIDAEADPGMNFSAFADVQRFARIDAGVLISLDWRPMRAATLARLDNRTASPAHDAHKLHFAAGHILYKDGSKGMLLYVKATVTGDEPDYILDYERRHPTFPHESTSDQFFSEEQMEAYRALGFHAMRVALDQPPPIEEDAAAAERERDRLVKELRDSCRPIPA